MKNKIANILLDFKLNDHFKDATLALTVNYKDVVPSFRRLPIKTTTTSDILKLIKEDDIKSFNINAEIKTGFNFSEDIEFEFNWKRVTYTFYSSETDDNTCCFHFDYSGDAGSSNTSERLTRQDPDADPTRPHPITDNYVEWDDIGDLLNALIRYENMISRHHIEKTELIETIRKAKVNEPVGN